MTTELFAFALDEMRRRLRHPHRFALGELVVNAAVEGNAIDLAELRQAAKHADPAALLLWLDPAAGPVLLTPAQVASLAAQVADHEIATYAFLRHGLDWVAAGNATSEAEIAAALWPVPRIDREAARFASTSKVWRASV